MLKLKCEEWGGDDVPGKGNMMCEGPATGKSRVFIRQKNRMATVWGRERLVTGRSAVIRLHRALRAVVRCLEFTLSPWKATEVCSM